MLKKLSLSQKAILASLLVSFPVFVIFLYTYSEMKAKLKAEAINDLRVIAEGYEGHVYQFIEMSKRRASDFSSDGLIRDRLAGAVRGETRSIAELEKHLLKNKLPLDKTIRYILVLGPDGVAAAATDLRFSGKDFSGEDFLMKGLKGAAFSESLLMGDDRPILIASSPVRSDSRTIGAVANLIPSSELKRLLTGEFMKELGSTSAPAANGLKAFIVDKDRFLLAGNFDTANKYKIDSLPVKECFDNGRQAAGFYENHAGLEVAGASVCFQPLGWALVIEIDREKALAPTNAILTGALATGVIMAVLIGMLFLIYLRAVVLPLKKISKAVKDITEGDYEINIPVRSEDEIGTLSAAFNRMARDIKNGLQALRSEKEKLRKAQKMARMGGWEWDLKKNEIAYSDEARRIFSSLPGGIGTTYESFVNSAHPKDRALMEKRIDEALRSVRPFSIDYMVSLQDGSSRILNAQGELQSSDSGNMKMIGIIQDITDRKRMEEAQARLTSIIEATTDFVATAGPDGNVLYMNNAARRLLGIGQDESIEGLRIEQTHPEWAKDLIFSKAIPSAAQEGYWSGETAFLSRDGKEVPAWQVILSHKDSEGSVQFYSTIARDITDKRLAQEALIKKTAELDSLNRELHELTMKMTVLEEKERKRFAEILHENIGQNLVAIKLAFKGCLKGCPDIAERREAVDQIVELLDESIQTSRDMTNDLYTAPLKYRGLSNRVDWYIESILRPAGVSVAKDISSAVEGLTDEARQVIFSAIRESFQNIIKYSYATRVAVSCERSGNEMFLRVKDNGVGFNYDEVRAKPGRGFGLILMREWAKSINGSLTIKSEQGKGTEIIMVIPFTED